jgi:hypothetical protein
MQSQPLGLTTPQLDAIFQACRPLDWHAQQNFMQALADRLLGRGEVGDGELGQLIRELQGPLIRTAICACTCTRSTPPRGVRRRCRRPPDPALTAWPEAAIILCKSTASALWDRNATVRRYFIDIVELFR